MTRGHLRREESFCARTTPLPSIRFFVDPVERNQQTRHPSRTTRQQFLSCFQRGDTAAPIDESKRAVGDELRDYALEVGEFIFKLTM